MCDSWNSCSNDAAMKKRLKMKNVETVFSLARKHLTNNTSARACMEESIQAKNTGDIDKAVILALRSLAHSVGILHCDYQKAFIHSGIKGEIRLVSLTWTKE